MRQPIDPDHAAAYCVNIVFVSLALTGIAALFGLGIVALILWPFIIALVLFLAIYAGINNALVRRQARRQKQEEKQ